MDLTLPLTYMFNLAAIGGLCIYKVEQLILFKFLIILNLIFRKQKS